MTSPRALSGAAFATLLLIALMMGANAKALARPQLQDRGAGSFHADHSTPTGTRGASAHISS